MPASRRLTAILAADVAGYSRLMGADEKGTHERLRAHLRELVKPKIAGRGGRIADGMVEQIITALSRIRWLFAIARVLPTRARPST
jgi:adenylate cyclase